MRSPLAAMTWEFLYRGRWAFTSAATGLLGMSAFLLCATHGAFSRSPNPFDDESAGLIAFSMGGLNAVAIGAIVLNLQFPLAHLYSTPVATTLLVVGRLAPTMVLVFLETAVPAALVNATFGVNWPALGVAAITSIAVGWSLTVLWCFANSRWMIVAIGALSLLIGERFFSHFNGLGRAFGTWRSIEAGEAWAMALTAALAVPVATYGVDRNRRGEPPISLGWFAWVERWFRRWPANRTSFVSPHAAHFWSQWHTNGIAAPAAVPIIWLFIAGVAKSQDAAIQDFADFIIPSNFSMWIVAILGGLYVGCLGTTRTAFPMASHVATRPMTSSQLAQVQLRVAGTSWILAWGIWAAIVAAIFAMLSLCYGVAPDLGGDDSTGPTYWLLYGAFSLVGSWTVMATFAALALCGRPHLITVTVAAPTAALIIPNIAAQLFLPQNFAEIMIRLTKTAVLVSSLAAVGGVAWLFVAALRREFISRRTVVAASMAWVAGMALCLLQMTRFPVRPFSWDLEVALYALATALAVAPFASFPMAVHFNRVR